MSQEIIKFNIGGVRYEVARSLLDAHPDTMLAKSASEQWHKDPTQEIFMERDGERFRYVLDYLRDGKVLLPFHLSKEALLLEFQYYLVEDVKEEFINDKAATSFLYVQFASSIQDLIKSWDAEQSKHQNISHTLAMCSCILGAFGKQRRAGFYWDIPFSIIGLNLPMKNYTTFKICAKDCNEYLKHGGVRINESDFKVCYNGYTDDKLHYVPELQSLSCRFTLEIIM